MDIFTGLVLLQFSNMRIEYLFKKHRLLKLPKNFGDRLKSRLGSKAYFARAFRFRLRFGWGRSGRSVLVLVVIVLAVIGVVTALVVYRGSRHQPDSRRKYYYSQLGVLSTQINAVQKIIEDSNHDVHEQDSNLAADNTENYERALSGALGVCRQLDDYKVKPSEKVKHSEKTKPSEKVTPGQKVNPSKPDNLDDKVASVSRLCHDLEGVLDYAYRLSIKSKGFMQYQINPSSGNDSDTRRDLGTLLPSTASALKQLKADPIGDPAVPELIAYIETVKQAVDSSNDNASLSKALQAQQKNFISARYYFWRTTIDIGALEGSITKLQQNFKAT